MARMCIMGFDCLSPQLVFDDFAASLPNLHTLAKRGIGAPMRSCAPPITVPAWAAMVTGHDPGSLGLYGFRDRADRSYHARRLASSLSFHQPPVWSLLSRHGLRCRVAGVPQTYPPKPLNGYMVTGCMSPAHSPPPTYPSELGTEVLRAAPNFRTDIADFRALSPGVLRKQIHSLTEATFQLAEAWVQQDDWDFLMFADMGCDRLHHGLWHHCRPEHPTFIADSEHADALRAYYVALDEGVGRLLQHLRADDVVMVLSDHGAQAMHGAIALNDWLIARGDLVLKTPPRPGTPQPFDAAAVDWAQTRAWSDGGYVGRIYLNVQGRELQGVVRAEAVETTLTELTRDLLSMSAFGHPPHAVYRSEDLYREVRGIAPDLWVYLGDLRLRALGSWGHSNLFVQHNDQGIDGANHAHDGVLIAAGADFHMRDSYSLYDIAPTVLQHFGVAGAANMVGSSLV